MNVYDVMLQFESSDETLTVDIAPIIRDYIEAEWRNDNTAISFLPFQDTNANAYGEIYSFRLSARTDDELNPAYGESDPLKVLLSKASFSESRNLGAFFANKFGGNYEPLAPRLTVAANTDALTASDISRAYEISAGDFFNILMPAIPASLGEWTYYCVKYGAAGSYIDTYSTSSVDFGRREVVSVPIITSGSAITKGCYYKTYFEGAEKTRAVLFHVRDCNHDGYSILYRSRLGGWWFIPTHLKHYRTVGITTEVMGLAGQPISSHMRERKAVSVTSQGQWTLNTDLLSRPEDIADVEDMLKSTELYIMHSGSNGCEYIPVTLADSTYTINDRKQDFCPQYSFNLIESFDE